MAEDNGIRERMATVEATMTAHIKSCEEDRDERQRRWGQIEERNNQLSASMDSIGERITDGLSRVHARVEETQKDTASTIREVTESFTASMNEVHQTRASLIQKVLVSTALGLGSAVVGLGVYVWKLQVGG